MANPRIGNYLIASARNLSLNLGTSLGCLGSLYFVHFTGLRNAADAYAVILGFLGVMLALSAVCLSVSHPPRSGQFRLAGRYALQASVLGVQVLMLVYCRVAVSEIPSIFPNSTWVVNVACNVLGAWAMMLAIPTCMLAYWALDLLNSELWSLLYQNSR